MGRRGLDLRLLLVLGFDPPARASVRVGRQRCGVRLIHTPTAARPPRPRAARGGPHLPSEWQHWGCKARSLDDPLPETRWRRARWLCCLDTATHRRRGPTTALTSHDLVRAQRVRGARAPTAPSPWPASRSRLVGPPLGASWDAVRAVWPSCAGPFAVWCVWPGVCALLFCCCSCVRLIRAWHWPPSVEPLWCGPLSFAVPGAVRKCPPGRADFHSPGLRTAGSCPQGHLGLPTGQIHALAGLRAARRGRGR